MILIMYFFGWFYGSLNLFSYFKLGDNYMII